MTTHRPPRFTNTAVHAPAMTCGMFIGLRCGMRYEAVNAAAFGESTSICIDVHSHLGFRMLLPTYFQNVSICDWSSARVVDTCPLAVEYTAPVSG